MNVACDYEAPMQMLTTEKYIAAGTASNSYNNTMKIIDHDGGGGVTSNSILIQTYITCVHGIS